MAWAPPSKPGDTDPLIVPAKAYLRRFSYGKGLDDTPIYTAEFGQALMTFAPKRNAEIDAGTKAKPYVNVGGVFDWAMKKQLGLLEPAPPPPPGPRHAALVFRGTGGVIGLDYVSQVCQGAADLVEEFNPEFPASMGGLPPGAPGTPSARDAINIGYRSGVNWIRQNPDRTIVLGGYSLGEIVAAMLTEALLKPGGELYEHRDRFVCSFHIGPPARPEGASFYGGTAAPGVGISSWRMDPTLARDPRNLWLCDPEDMYGAIPVPVPGGTGDIMETVFDLVTESALNDPLGTLQAMIPHLLEIAQDAGIFGLIGLGNAGPATSGGLLGGLLGGAGGLLGAGTALLNPLAVVPMLLPLFVGVLPGLIAGIGGGVGGNLTGPAAAAQAAVLGMKFLVAGTRPHIEYHLREVWPGQTYLGLGIQHVRDWSARTPVG
ncbi:lysin B [Mycobacterium phage Adawi]|uniref:Lysin B n=1 Tax=Mycobacterium phage Adawi TaxID=1354507 RepID=T2A7C1_9CAUD|nr:lysin B [Mycobacterium phage Adawi]AGU91961.1 lysin B [Mycobacterium phage Adawi]